MNWYLAVLKKYAVFDGRSRRKEYWMYVLFNLLVGIVLAIIDGVLGTRTSSGQGLLGGLYTLAVFLPGLGVAIRRLHDTGRSGWWFLIIFTCIGIFPFLYWMILEGTPGENQYGPNPKDSPDPV
ncbi:MAG: DUF805 domain-containing protein [Planctomycetota bacterium]